MSDNETTQQTAPFAEMKKIANKADVWHLVQKGALMQLHFDMETFGLDRDFAQIASYGDALGDIAGNFVDSQELHVKRPDRYLASPDALLVTRTHPAELDEESRLPHRVAMGRIAERFESSALAMGRLNLPEAEVSFHTVRKTGEDRHEKSFREDVLEYPLRDGSGQKVSHVRFHPQRNRIAYRFDDDPASPYYENVENNYYVDERDGSKWKFVEPRVAVSGYRIKWADIGWLRANLVKAGFHPSNIFFTHSRATISNKQKPKNYAVDTYSTALNAHLFGPQGEERLKLGTKIDPRSGRTVVTAALSAVMEANTRYGNEARHVRAGVFMPDGTVYDRRRAHRSPAYDSQASFALSAYIRDIAPGVARAAELQADENELRMMLPGMDPAHPHPPLYALVRNDYPNAPVASPAVFLGFDDQLGQMRRAIMVRLDGDLRHFTYRGKTLAEMDGEEIAAMMKKERGPEALIRAEPVRRWPGVMKLEDALHTGAGETWDFEQVMENFQFLSENEKVMHAIREAVEINNWDMTQRAEPANPMMEEQAVHNGFGDLDYIEAEADMERRRRGKARHLPQRGATSSVVEMIYNKASDIYKYHNAMDELLHRLALQPHPVEWSKDPADADNFRDLLKRVKRRMEDKDCPYARAIFNREIYDFVLSRIRPMDQDKVLAFRWKLMSRLLADDEAARNDKSSRFGEGLFNYGDMKKGRIVFANLSRDFRVVDRDGREMTVGYLKKQYGHNPRLVQKNLERGAWRIEFYRLSSEPSITATLFQFADMGRLREAPPVWQQRYETLKRLYLNGPPNEEPSKMRWPGIARIKKDLDRLEANARTDGREGVARVFSDVTAGQADIHAQEDESRRIIADYRDYIARIEKKCRLSAAYSQAAQYDPVTGLPYDRIEHEIPAKRFVVVDVPDAHLRRPLEDVRYAPYSLVVPALNARQKKAVEDGKHIVFRGQQSGRLYYGGPAALRPAPAENASFGDYYDSARRAYENEAGVAFPADGKRDVLLVQKLQPVAQSRRDLDASAQAVRVPSLFFDGMTCPRMAHFDRKLTGLALPADYVLQALTPGKAIQFREMEGPLAARLNHDGGAETGHIYESTLQKVRRVTLGEILDEVNSGRLDDKKAQSFGFPGAFDMWEKLNQIFLDQNVHEPLKEEIVLMEFKVVDKRSWAYFNPPAAPQAAITYDGNPVPPSAYRPAAPKPPANDNAPQKAAPRRRQGPDRGVSP